MSPEALEIHMFSYNLQKHTPCKICEPQNMPKDFLTFFIISDASVKLQWSKKNN